MSLWLNFTRNKKPDLLKCKPTTENRYAFNAISRAICENFVVSAIITQLITERKMGQHVILLVETIMHTVEITIYTDEIIISTVDIIKQCRTDIKMHLIRK